MLRRYVWPLFTLCPALYLAHSKYWLCFLTGVFHKLHYPGKGINEAGGEIKFEGSKNLEVSEVHSCFLYLPQTYPHLWGEVILKPNFPFDIKNSLPSVVFSTVHILFLRWTSFSSKDSQWCREAGPRESWEKRREISRVGLHHAKTGKHGQR